MPEGRLDIIPARWGWPWRTSLTARILAVNIIALALLAGSLFYIDSYRKELFAERFSLATAEAQIAAAGLDDRNAKQVPERLVRIGAERQMRLRLRCRQGRGWLMLPGHPYVLLRRFPPPWCCA